jgi:hypothetical protein
MISLFIYLLFIYMKKVTYVKSNCRHHFVRISIGPFEARVYSKLIVAACRDASVIRGIFDTNSENSEFVSKIPDRPIEIRTK